MRCDHDVERCSHHRYNQKHYFGPGYGDFARICRGDVRPGERLMPLWHWCEGQVAPQCLSAGIPYRSGSDSAESQAKPEDIKWTSVRGGANPY